MFFTYTSFMVLSGITILGALAGLMSPFIHARRQSLVGDVVGHAALPGVAAMFLATYSTSHTVLLCGGMCSALLGIALMSWGEKYTTLKHDALLAIMLASTFGFGLVLLTMVQKVATARQAILSSFLLGSAATLVMGDIQRIAVLGIIILCIVVLAWRWLQVCTFDADYAATIGVPATSIRGLITSLVVVVVIVGLPAVGMLLMSTLLIAPAAAMRQWSSSWRTLIIASMVYGATTALMGGLASLVMPQVPTGPLVVLLQALGTLLCVAGRQYASRRRRIVRPIIPPSVEPSSCRVSSCKERSCH